ncbi:hypothetical protein [Streptomyces phaeochromogenes]|uniref:hypothetical protein n=1 Tax=Streptomyces phaeochromogenes TaxID=1923 RepID=UPI003404ED12
MEHKIPRVGPLGLLAGVAGEVAATSRAAWSAGTGRTEQPRPDAAPSGSLRQDEARGESLKPDAGPSGPLGRTRRENGEPTSMSSSSARESPG